MLLSNDYFLITLEKYGTNINMNSVLNKSEWNKAVSYLKNGELVVMPTDTIFGIVALAENRRAVEKVYKARGRNPKKPCIILCSSVSDLTKLKIKIKKPIRDLLIKIWPNPVSVIFSCPDSSMKYLHRGTKTLAIRIPKNKKLRELIKKTGPLIAPSANPEGDSPAKNIEEAWYYFGDKVDVYIKGKANKKQSTLISLVDGKFKMIREGAWRVPNNLINSVK